MSEMDVFPCPRAADVMAWYDVEPREYRLQVWGMCPFRSADHDFTVYGPAKKSRKDAKLVRVGSKIAARMGVRQVVNLRG